MGILNLEQALAISACLVVGYFITSTVYQWHRLRHIPGPFLASFSYLWIGYSGYSGKQFARYKDVGEKYGPVVRVGPNEVITDDPETIRHISSTKNMYHRSEWYDGARFQPGDAMFTLLEPVKHDKYKAKTAHGYSGRETPGIESAIDEQIANLIKLIRREYVVKAGTRSRMVPLDLSKVIPLFTLDVISRIALGKEFGGLEANRDVVRFYEIVEAILPELNVVADVPWIRRIVFSDICLRLFGPKTTDKSGMGLMMKMTNEEVRKKYAGDNKESNDMLGSFRRHGLNQTECQIEALFMFVAGSETTASAIKITLFYLMATPSAYNRLKAEMRTAIENGRASSPITVAEAKELPYLQAVLYEGLRIRPMATATFGKEVPPDGDNINGHFIPGGTTIGPNIPSLMYSRALFGEDADIFRPERFLEADPATRTEMQRNVDLVFGYGRWMCAGKFIAWLELNKCLFELLRHFDFQIFDPKVGFKCFSHGAWVDHDMFVAATESDSR
ncbi:cytochrome P450 [Xylaria grammica]|nr:cytochrome P450 [Xylaria grammica]